jgi:hypothetical protein
MPLITDERPANDQTGQEEGDCEEAHEKEVNTRGGTVTPPFHKGFLEKVKEIGCISGGDENSHEGEDAESGKSGGIQGTAGDIPQSGAYGEHRAAYGKSQEGQGDYEINHVEPMAESHEAYFHKLQGQQDSRGRKDGEVLDVDHLYPGTGTKQ